ncbi:MULTISPECIES: response regulator transcription factor [Crateriforma]|nr:MULTISPECIES: response regulator [Crateriforma]
MPATTSNGRTAESVVYLIDDYPDDLLLLRKLCESIGLKVRTFASPTEFLQLADLGAKGCIVVDLMMPQMSGLELHRELASRGSSIPIIVVTAHADAATCREAFKSGVFDFIEKSFNPHELVQVIQKALRHSEDTEHVSRIREQSLINLDRISPREREVMELLAAGKTLKEIGQSLGISVQTASKHRGKLFEKLDVQNEVELFKLLLTVNPDRGRPSAGEASGV